jgi:site-specific DNA-adenine methylase
MGQELVELMPRGGREYVEPLAGYGNVFWALETYQPNSFEQYSINDFQTADFFRYLQTHGDKVRVPSDLTEMVRKYNIYKERRKEHPLSIEAILLQPFLSPRGGYGKGGATSRGVRAETYRATLRACKEIMLRTRPHITGLEWTDLNLDRLGWDDFVFLDPPYYNADVRAYKPWTLKQHMQMVRILEKAKFKWMLTEYKQPFYTKAFGSPIYTKETTCILSNEGSPRTECVWANYR